MKLSVCGLGKLGTPIALVFAASDIPVTGLDVDQRKVAAINNQRAPIEEPDVESYMGLNSVMNNLWATIVPQHAVQCSEACLFVTPTPSQPDGSFNHSNLLQAISGIAGEVATQRKYGFLFIVNSTVSPGFLNREVVPMLDQRLGKGAYRLAYKPEFIALGTVIRDLHNPDLLLIGADSEETGAAVESLYRRMVFNTPAGPPAKHMTLVEAELAKIALNCAVTAKISFANQIGLIAEKLGADAARVLDAVGSDHRIGKHALLAGIPYGGPCFPRDNRMLLHLALRLGERAPISEATDVMNHRLYRTVLDRVDTEGDIGILGLAYKPGTCIAEDSPGTWWRQALMSRGRCVKAHDVAAPHPNSIEEVLRCRTVIVATAWKEYYSVRIIPGTKLIDPMNVIHRPGQAELLAEAEVGIKR